MKQIKRNENRKSKRNRTSQSLSMFASRLGGTTSIEKENKNERSERVKKEKEQFNGMEKQTSSAGGDERSSWWSCRFVVRVTRSTVA